jgi:hypothetical protein
MKSEAFIARLKRSALASTIASACLAPQAHSAVVAAPIDGGEVVFNDTAAVPEHRSMGSTGETLTLTLTQTPKEWSRELDHEFRRLALEEAKGELSSPLLERLEMLSRWRDQLKNPRTPDEILLQLRRDRLLEKMSEALKAYVEFKEGQDKERASAR